MNDRRDDVEYEVVTDLSGGNGEGDRGAGDESPVVLEDADNDGVTDSDDACPVAAESADRDVDAIPDCVDEDDDGDGCADGYPGAPLTEDRCYALAWRGGTSPYPLPLPWFDRFSSDYDLNEAGHPDVDPADGWVVLSRKLGDDGVVAPLPHIVLYSRHTGALRVFTFVPESHLSGSYLVATFGQTGTSTGVSGWADDKNPYFGEPDPSFTQVYIGHAPVTPYSWVMAEFDARGFDPRVLESPELFRASNLHIELAIVQESELSLFGTLELQGLMTNGAVGITGRQSGSGSFLTDAINGFATGKKYKKDVTSGIDEAKEIAAKHPNTWWSQPLAGAAAALGTWAPQVAMVAGFVTAFVGGRKQPRPQPMQWRMDLAGSLKLEGTLKYKQPLLTINLPVPGIGASPEGYDEPLGLVALTARPVIRAHGEYVPCYAWYSEFGGGSGNGRFTLLHSLDPVAVIANEAAGVKIQKVEYALVSETTGPSEFSEEPPTLTNVSQVDVVDIYGTCIPSEADAAPITAQRYTAVAVKVTLEQFETSANGPEDLVLLRVYPAEVVNTFSVGSL